MRFIVDEMHGKLIRWLRMLGYDTTSSSAPSDNQPQHDPEQWLIEKCLSEYRVAISNDRELLQKVETQFYHTVKLHPETYFRFNFEIPMAYGLISPCCYPTSQDITQILSELQSLFDISLDYSTEKSRCSLCNAELRRVIRKEDIRPKVPEKVYRFQKKFWICQNAACAQIYWNGTQLRSTIDTLAEIKRRGIKQ